MKTISMSGIVVDNLERVGTVSLWLRLLTPNSLSVESAMLSIVQI